MPWRLLELLRVSDDPASANTDVEENAPTISQPFASLLIRPEISSREGLLAQELSPEGLAIYAHQVAIFDTMDREDIAPSTGLTVRTENVPIASSSFGACIRADGSPANRSWRFC
jgi:hypothetical protein